MGASGGGIIVKIDTSAIDMQKVVKDLFGNNIGMATRGCDPRVGNCIYIGKGEGFLSIVNSNMAEKFFAGQSLDPARKYIEYFNTPGLIFAYEEYDSGGTYSYSIIEAGKLIRQFRSITYETSIDYGEPYPIELAWKNTETIQDDIGDGEFETLYKHPKAPGSYVSKEDIPKMILSDLMQEKLGFTTWTMNPTEAGYYNEN